VTVNRNARTDRYLLCAKGKIGRARGIAEVNEMLTPVNAERLGSSDGAAVTGDS
jgi:hypothetical protein